MKSFLVAAVALCALSFSSLSSHAADPRRTAPPVQNIKVGDTGTKLTLLKTGRVTLVAGVATVTDAAATTTANIFVFKQVGAGTQGVTYLMTRSAGSFTLTAKAADGATTATADTSQIGYLILQP